ncbi:drug/metabolite transporter (DMT)-like permease [Enterococcus sp. PF1-24]|uniref:DMT family transporter n=1 Tax=unclassified Enterococcus TaxID=2608891 RepID=UPI0024769E7F|nr:MULTISPECIES: DMT family transporter [unclassified Enterococcus]MDH6365629.1 drug/metabolite transporter (DMT)-like permease [Enterococcus sp. PFB1-1]MDH6402724.1 drug/metabolite transporter (DMT)-like permease [Enterococcus sp. PF1-24]
MLKYKNQIGLFLVAIIWGTGFVATEIALQQYHVLQILALRFLLAAVLMALFFHKNLKQIKKSTVKKGAILGSVLYLAFLFQTIGLTYTTASKNAFLTAVNVVLVPVIGTLFLKLPLARNVVIGAVFSLIGIGFLSLEGLNGLNLGDGLTLICAVLFALQILLTNTFLKNEDAIALTLMQLTVAALLALVVSLILGYPLITFNVTGNLAVFYLGAVSTMLGFLIQTICQKQVSSNQTAVILSTEALFGMLASIIFLHEAVTFKMIIGALLIFAGVIVTVWQPKKILS